MYTWNHSIYQLHLSIEDIEPQIWRRILVSKTTTLWRFHKMLQALFGWKDYHLHQFEVGEIVFGMDYVDPEDDYTVSYSRVTLGKVLKRVGNTMTYLYDFGDDWEVTIVLEQTFEKDPEVVYPLCLEGKRAGPPEDSGSPHGFMNLMEILGDPKHEEYKACKKWVGARYDPEAFNLESIDKKMKSAANRKIPKYMEF